MMHVLLLHTRWGQWGGMLYSFDQCTVVMLLYSVIAFTLSGSVLPLQTHWQHGVLYIILAVQELLLMIQDRTWPNQFSLEVAEVKGEGKLCLQLISWWTQPKQEVSCRNVTTCALSSHSSSVWSQLITINPASFCFFIIITTTMVREDVPWQDLQFA